ncbi:hypothetical protein HaLaN_05315 [Haematococcus lacustris]|uniref:Uncharacterized protein n=1 Tax=Haematococcus lacustris TaxID=44745 RepID=A0A699YIN4_HAELA|nr:hypothetical protein HaLaN_05315 [Haematococcus lacustris]
MMCSPTVGSFQLRATSSWTCEALPAGAMAAWLSALGGCGRAALTWGQLCTSACHLHALNSGPCKGPWLSLHPVLEMGKHGTASKSAWVRVGVGIKLSCCYSSSQDLVVTLLIAILLPPKHCAWGRKF